MLGRGPTDPYPRIQRQSQPCVHHPSSAKYGAKNDLYTKKVEAQTLGIQQNLKEKRKKKRKKGGETGDKKQKEEEDEDDTKHLYSE